MCGNPLLSGTARKLASRGKKMNYQAPVSFVRLDEIAGSKALARREYLEFAALSLDHILLSAYDSGFDEIVTILSEMSRKLRTLSENALAEHLLK
jgi:hypothetical protein